MFGNGQVGKYTGEHSYIMRTEQFIATGTTLPIEGTSSMGWIKDYTGPDGKLYEKKNPKFYDANGEVVAALVKGDTFFCSYDLEVEGSVIDISAASFPGTLAA